MNEKKKQFRNNIIALFVVSSVLFFVFLYNIKIGFSVFEWSEETISGMMILNAFVALFGVLLVILILFSVLLVILILFRKEKKKEEKIRSKEYELIID